MHNFNPFKDHEKVYTYSKKNFFLWFIRCLGGRDFLRFDEPTDDFDFGILDYLFVIPALLKLICILLFSFFSPENPIANFFDNTPVIPLIGIIAALTRLVETLVEFVVLYPLAFTITFLSAPFLLGYHHKLQPYLESQEKAFNDLEVHLTSIFTSINSQDDNPIYTTDYNRLYQILLQIDAPVCTLQNLTESNQEGGNQLIIKPIFLTNGPESSDEKLILGVFLRYYNHQLLGFIMPSIETKSGITLMRDANYCYFNDAKIPPYSLNKMFQEYPEQVCLSVYKVIHDRLLETNNSKSSQLNPDQLVPYDENLFLSEIGKFLDIPCTPANIDNNVKFVYTKIFSSKEEKSPACNPSSVLPDFNA